MSRSWGVVTGIEERKRLPTGAALLGPERPLLILAIDIGAPGARGHGMADISKFSIVTYERKPGQWRAAITPIRRSGPSPHTGTVNSIVTPDDYASEKDAQSTAEKMIKGL